MDKELWSVFCQTGDPVGYLLCRAGEEKKKAGEKDGRPAEGAYVGGSLTAEGIRLQKRCRASKPGHVKAL